MGENWGVFCIFCRKTPNGSKSNSWRVFYIKNADLNPKSKLPIGGFFNFCLRNTSQFYKCPFIHPNSFFLITLKLSSIFISLIFPNTNHKQKTPSRFKNKISSLELEEKKKQSLISASIFFKEQANFHFNLSRYKEKS